MPSVEKEIEAMVKSQDRPWGPDPKYGAVEVGRSWCWLYLLVVEQDRSTGGKLIDHYDPENPCPGPHGIMWAAR